VDEMRANPPKARCRLGDCYTCQEVTNSWYAYNTIGYVLVFVQLITEGTPRSARHTFSAPVEQVVARAVGGHLAAELRNFSGGGVSYYVRSS
jgi:hypothetical protein